MPQTETTKGEIILTIVLVAFIIIATSIGVLLTQRLQTLAAERLHLLECLDNASARALADEKRYNHLLRAYAKRPVKVIYKTLP